MIDSSPNLGFSKCTRIEMVQMGEVDTTHSGISIKQVDAQRAINCKRAGHKELLISNY
jgi:hypothetical protein